MKKRSLFVLAALLTALAAGQTAPGPYVPSPQNLAAREWFRNAKFGLFIHWGPFSIPGEGGMGDE